MNKPAKILTLIISFLHCLTFFAQLDTILVDKQDSSAFFKEMKAGIKGNKGITLPASNDSTLVKNAERTKKDKDSNLANDTLRHSPRKATMLSAILPGAGQYYNKKYWKIPVIYAGFGVLGYSVEFNQTNYRNFKDELIRRQQGAGALDPDLERYSNANLDELQSFYRRNRDLSYIGIALFYLVNIIDATVDAHLFEFDMSDDLSMRWTGNQNDIIALGNFQPRLTFTFRF